jgi:histidinol-phosphatase (PHP family)
LFCDVVADQHVHPDYSFDATGTLDDYCQMAINMGLKEICFTTHYDADPERLEREGYMVIDGNREPLDNNSVDHYLNDIKRAHDKYWELGVRVRGGFEFGFFPGCEPMINDLKGKFNIEYSLGAVHSIDGFCICTREDAMKLFAKYTLSQLADKYYDLLDRSAATGVFDCLAHIEVYRRFGMEYYGDEVLTIHRGRI